MTALEQPSPPIQMPPGLSSLEEWEARLDHAIEMGRSLPWRHFNPDMVARILMALSLDIDEQCPVSSIRERMMTLRQVVHARIDRWKVYVEVEQTPGRGHDVRVPE